MMTVRVSPNTLGGTLRAPYSKSDAHRALMAAALCERPTDIRLDVASEDMRATIRCLEALGARLTSSDASETWFRMEPIPVGRDDKAALLDCGESGTTLRLLLPVVAALGISAEFTAHGRLPKRPLRELTEALASNGSRFSAPALPFALTGRMTPGTYELPGNISSQYISGLLLALPLLEGDSRICLTTKLESQAYVEMTRNTLNAFGVGVTQTDERIFCVSGRQQYQSPGRLVVEGDWSNAAFFLAAGALGKSITVSGLSPTSLQSDRAILMLLARFGAKIEMAGTDASVCGGELHAIDVDVSGIPDLFPVLAVVAARAQGTTRLFNAKRLRIKESDRIHAVAAMLASLGADVQEHEDALEIHGKPFLEGGEVDSMGDHRIAMAAALASIVCKNRVTIHRAEAVAKSYPNFFEDFNQMGGDACVINMG